MLKFVATVNWMLKPNKYHNGKIYKITSPSTDKIYIGSTTKKLDERLRKHKYDYKGFLNKKHHNVTSFEIIKYDDAKIELVKSVFCSNKKELEQKEGIYITLYRDIVVNKCVAGRSIKEYRKANKDKITEIAKEYYETNKDKIRAKSVCVCGGKYTYDHKARHVKSSKHKKYLERFTKTTKKH
jgi:hypothetical protein